MEVGRLPQRGQAATRFWNSTSRQDNLWSTDIAGFSLQSWPQVLSSIWCIFSLFLVCKKQMNFTQEASHSPREDDFVLSVCRALGIPARCVTNFASVHDCDGSGCVDIHWDQTGNTIADANTDPVWFVEIHAFHLKTIPNPVKKSSRNISFSKFCDFHPFSPAEPRNEIWLTHRKKQSVHGWPKMRPLPKSHRKQPAFMHFVSTPGPQNTESAHMAPPEQITSVVSYWKTINLMHFSSTCATLPFPGTFTCGTRSGCLDQTSREHTEAGRSWTWRLKKPATVRDFRCLHQWFSPQIHDSCTCRMGWRSQPK